MRVSHGDSDRHLDAGQGGTRSKRTLSSAEIHGELSEFHAPDKLTSPFIGIR
ncbi:hypothetical protein [Micromonospora sp. RTGN7]|uniref:hypothetical protein n=1 Tax=Micromonospora sp. RTGN7 TaxID=3016526 RepID=UPI0029FEE6C2|nr:hypothetical protein [Micromonospora sp. RTGN7]